MHETSDSNQATPKPESLEAKPTLDTSLSEDPASLMALVERDISIEEFSYHWLALQCVGIGAVDRGVVLLRQPDTNEFRPVAKWPLTEKVTTLSEVAHGVLDEECGLILELEDQPGYVAAAYPIHINNELEGIVALELKASDLSKIERLMGQLQWSVAWIELFFNRKQIGGFKSSEARSRASMELLAKVHAQEDFVSASMALVTELANKLSCERVSYSVPHGDKVKVEALSHSAQFGQRMNLVRAIGQAMEEALVLGEPVIFPGKDGRLSVPDHEALLEASGCHSVMTVPIFIDDRFYAALTLERSSESPFTLDELSFCQSLAVLCVPALEDKRLNRRGVFRFLSDRAKTQVKRLIGPDYVGRKLFAIISVLLVLFFSFATGSFRISANTLLEGEIQRVISAPFKGYIKTAAVKAGDRVSPGQVLAELDDRDMRLERENWLSQRSQYRHQYNQALGVQDRSEMNVAKAQMDQAAAQLALAEAKLSRSRLTAPFDGTVISGDLSQRLGAYVEQGEVLFEIAPLDAYRVILLVDEKYIAEINNQLSGELVLASLPKVVFNFDVVNITPITVAEEGANLFRVEARLSNDEVTLMHYSDLRPGMEGVGKIYVGERKLIEIWTRGLLDWLRLFAWKWLP